MILNKNHLTAIDTQQIKNKYNFPILTQRIFEKSNFVPNLFSYLFFKNKNVAPMSHFKKKNYFEKFKHFEFIESKIPSIVNKEKDENDETDFKSLKKNLDDNFNQNMVLIYSLFNDSHNNSNNKEYFTKNKDSILMILKKLYFLKMDTKLDIKKISSILLNSGGKFPLKVSKNAEHDLASIFMKHPSLCSNVDDSDFLKRKSSRDNISENNYPPNYNKNDANIKTASGALNQFECKKILDLIKYLTTQKNNKTYMDYLMKDKVKMEGLYDLDLMAIINSFETDLKEKEANNKESLIAPNGSLADIDILNKQGDNDFFSCVDKIFGINLKEFIREDLIRKGIHSVAESLNTEELLINIDAQIRREIDYSEIVFFLLRFQNVK